MKGSCLHHGCGLHPPGARLPLEFSAPAARELSRKIRNAQSLLARHPEMGKVKPASNGVRILVIVPYVIEYEVDSDGILILIIRHGRQDERHDEEEDVDGE